MIPQYVEVKFFNKELINKLNLYQELLNYKVEKNRSFFKTDGALAFDLHAIIEEPLVLYPHHSIKIPTGLALQMWSDDMEFGLLIAIRSSLSDHLELKNKVGIIDCDFQGQIFTSLFNRSKDNFYTIEPGQRIAQAMIVPKIQFNEDHIKVVEEFTKHTSRDSAGFGTTGKF